MKKRSAIVVAARNTSPKILDLLRSIDHAIVSRGERVKDIYYSYNFVHAAHSDVMQCTSACRTLTEKMAEVVVW